MAKADVAGRTLARYQDDLGMIELSWCREGEQETWTILDEIAGHRSHENRHGAWNDFAGRIKDRLTVHWRPV